MPVYAIQANMIDRADTARCNGKGWSDEGASYTLGVMDRHAIVICFPTLSGSQDFCVNTEVALTWTGKNPLAIATRPALPESPAANTTPMEQPNLFAQLAGESASISSSADHPARHSQSPDSERDWTTLVATSCLPIWQLLRSIAPVGSSGKMFRGFSVRTTDGISEPSSEGWGNAGMGTPTEFWTLNLSEHASFPSPFPNGDAVCSLSDILETGDVPRRFFLTVKACQGILRRAEKRGKELPIALRFWKSVQKTDFCWDYIGALNEKGYGIYWNGSEQRLVPLVAESLLASDYKGPGHNRDHNFVATYRIDRADTSGGQCAVALSSGVRRLTPVECERLQGFPDGWTQIPWNRKPASECPDGRRYKAVGNSMSTNVMGWIGERIEWVEEILRLDE